MERKFDEIRTLVSKYQTGAFFASNFAIGAILMMKFAREAAKYFQMLISSNYTMIKSWTLHPVLP